MRTLFIFLLVVCIGLGTFYFTYNYMNEKDPATEQQLQNVKQNFQKKVDSLEAEHEELKRNHKITHRKIDKVNFKVDVIQSKQNITQLKIDSLSGDVKNLEYGQDTLMKGLHAIYLEVKSRRSKSFIEKLLSL